MSIVLNGVPYEIPGVRTISWLDSPEVRQIQFRGTRTRPVHLIVLHSASEETPHEVKPGKLTQPNPYSLARYAVDNGRASWDATLLTDGTLLWHNDPLKYESYHATVVNPVSLGIELQQGPHGELYEDQLAAEVSIVDFLTKQLGIQRQIPWFEGHPDRRVISRLRSGGDSVVGVVAHRNVDSNRSDPGDFIFDRLKRAGYEGFDFQGDEDRRVWAQRQAALGITADGIPGSATVAALRQAGHTAGLWVTSGASWWIAGALAAIAAAVYFWKR